MTSKEGGKYNVLVGTSTVGGVGGCFLSKLTAAEWYDQSLRSLQPIPHPFLFFFLFFFFRFQILRNPKSIVNLLSITKTKQKKKKKQSKDQRSVRLRIV